MSSLLIRASTVRLAIFISTIIIATIIVFQLVWLKKVYHFEEKEFNHNVVKTVRGLYEDLEITTYNSSHLNELIENPAPDLYLANIPLPVNKDSLVSYLQYELEDVGVFTDCLLGVYSADSAKYVFTELLASAGVQKSTSIPLPELRRGYDHIALYFPNRRQYILSQMNFWILSSVILLLVLLLFGGSLYFFYKQKFVNDQPGRRSIEKPRHNRETGQATDLCWHCRVSICIHERPGGKIAAIRIHRVTPAPFGKTKSKPP